MANALFVIWQQRGLSYFPSVYIIPINQVSLIIMGTILGGVYFGEFRDFEAVDAVMFMFGILLTSFGVIVLAAGHVVEIQIPLIGSIMSSGKSSNECHINRRDLMSKHCDYLSVERKASDASNPSCVAADNNNLTIVNHIN